MRGCDTWLGAARNFKHSRWKTLYLYENKLYVVPILAVVVAGAYGCSGTILVDQITFAMTSQVIRCVQKPPRRRPLPNTIHLKFSLPYLKTLPNMSDDQQPSSARAMLNSAAGTVRGGVAQVTGNPSDQAAADKKKGISRG